MKPFVQPSVNAANSRFSQVPSADIQRSRFDRSFAHKTTIPEAGYLCPVFLDEVLPGDTFNLKSTSFARLATPLRPIMDNMYLDVHYFFVPNRLVWDDFQRFMGERDDPDDDPSEYVVPNAYYQPWVIPNSGTASNGSPKLANYFGLPRRGRTGFKGGQNISVLPFRAYYLIFNEWFRDQNLQNSVRINRSSDVNPSFLGDNPNNDYVLRRNKRKDYFTSCLPWPQKGDPVLIPLSGEIPVYGYDDIATQYNHFAFYNDPLDPEAGYRSADLVGNSDSPPLARVLHGSGDVTNKHLFLNPDNQVALAKLDAVDLININDLRTAFQIQRLLERDARGGTRYVELVLSHFGVRSDDARLQRPEFLGSDSARINIHPLASMATVPDEAPQGSLAAIGTSVNRAGFSKSFTEHGWVIGLASVRADLTYQQGIDRMFQRLTRYDFYWPALAHLGEQPVYKRELLFTGEDEHDNAIFGYQERWAEYRYKNSLVTGRFNSDDDQSLDVWHLSQHFDVEEDIQLDDAFIKEDPPVDRIVAVPSEPHFLLDVWFDYDCTRPMPIYSVPGMIDHF